MKTKTLNLLCLLAFLVGIQQAAATVLLSDNFDSNSIDLTKWTTNTSWGNNSCPGVISKVIATNQRIEFTARGYLNTVTNYDPSAPGGLLITGTWTILNNACCGDVPTVATRSSGTPSSYNSGSGEVVDGIRFKLQPPSGQFQLLIVGSGGATVTGYNQISNSLSIAIGDIVNFAITDDGTNLTFSVTKAGNPTNSAYATAICTNHLAVNEISFYNREQCGDNSALDNVVVQTTQTNNTAQLTNIVISPANPIIAVGSNVQFTATEQFSDGSSQVVTNGGTNSLWSSSNPAVAPITTNGVATGWSRGVTTISATVGSISGTASLTVSNGVTIWYVWTNSPANGPGTTWATAYHDIQSAVNATADGDTVLVTNGFYNTGGMPAPGNVISNRVFITNVIAVISVNGPQVTTICGFGDGSSLQGESNSVRCVYLQGGLLSGFTITNGFTYLTPGNGSTDGTGGGVWSTNGTVTNCVITGCWEYGYGGGGIFGGNAYNCILIGNTGFDYGIAASQCNLFDCLIQNNSWNGSTKPAVYKCSLNNCTVVSNAIGVSQCYSTNSVIVSNSLNYDAVSSSYFDHCCTAPLPTNGVGNISADPQFTNPAAGDFHLLAASPCINAGNNVAVVGTTDLDGNPRIIGGVVDMGAYEYQSIVPVLTNLVVAPAVFTIAVGWPLQYGMTGYFNDGSSQSETANVSWSSSNPSVATINSAGDATGVASGTTTITASYGSVSGSATLTVVAPPAISIQPTNNIVSPNGSVTLSVSAIGGGLNYQWRLNGTNIAGATGATYTIPIVNPATVGVYTVVVNNFADSITSQAAIVGTTAIEMFAGIIVNGPIGTNYLIQAGSTIGGTTNWTTITNLALPSQPYIYIDYSTPFNSQHFYRAMPQ